MSTKPVKLTYSTPEDPFIKKTIIRSIERITGRPLLERIYNSIIKSTPSHEEIWSLIIKKLDLRLDYNHEKLNQVPSKDPIVFIANHPFGVIDGVILGYLVSLVKPSFKFLVNEVLCKEEILNHFFLPIDFAETKSAQRTNISTRKEALKRLSNNEPIVIFPSGGVATAPSFWKKTEELEWKRFVVKLIRNSNATVIPIFFHGHNSRMFQIVSNISMDLRLGMLLNEVRNKMGKTIKISIGNPIPETEWTEWEKENLLNLLKEKVESLGE